MASAVDRTSMVRIPLGNEKSARVEVRTVAPDANPYLAIYTIFKAGLEGPIKEKVDRKAGVKKLPDNIQSAIDDFSRSEFIRELIGFENQQKFAELKRAAADRCPRELGKTIKEMEILYHHEVQNQLIWKSF
jgi:glutamine synthetase